MAMNGHRSGRFTTSAVAENWEFSAVDGNTSSNRIGRVQVRLSKRLALSSKVIVDFKYRDSAFIPYALSGFAALLINLNPFSAIASSAPANPMTPHDPACIAQ